MQWVNDNRQRHRPCEGAQKRTYDKVTTIKDDQCEDEKRSRHQSLARPPACLAFRRRVLSGVHYLPAITLPQDYSSTAPSSRQIRLSPTILAEPYKPVMLQIGRRNRDPPPFYMNKARGLTPRSRNRQGSGRCTDAVTKRRRRPLHVAYKESCERTNIAIKAHGSPEENPTKTLAGAIIGDLDIFMRRELRLPNEVNGVVVYDVPENSLAGKAGLRAGDIISEINCASVINANDALIAANSWKDDRILLEVWTEKGTRHLTIHRAQDA